MDSFEPIIQIINEYLSKNNYRFAEENLIDLNFVRLNGLSNSIYVVKIIDSTNNELKHELIYRKYGSIGELVDRKSEKEIIDYLSDLNLTPKILKSDKLQELQDQISS